MKFENIVCLVTGTSLGVIGTGLSVTEIQAIVSIVCTILGFLIAVVLPYIIKLVKKIREAKADGVITKEEKEDIIKTAIDEGKEVVEAGKDVIDTINGKKGEDNKHD